MSSSSFIDINLTKNHDLDAIEVIRTALGYGWELNDYGKISYLPLGDDDNFSWKDVPLESKSQVFAELESKQELKEIIGVVLTYRDTQIGGNLLFLFKEKQISFSLSINTKKQNNGITDFSWYEQTIFPWLRIFKPVIESVYFCQSDSGGNIEFEKRLSGKDLP